MSTESNLPAVITDLKPADCNPRIITPEALDGLKSSVAEFGDIGGIVFNVRLGCLVAGHQRVAALREKFGDGLTIQPDGFGNGRIDTSAGPFGVRFVDWDETRTHAAMLVANNPEIQGDWTDAAVAMLDRLHENAGDMFAAMKFDPLLASLRKELDGMTPPEQFRSVGVDLVTHYQCPKCAYRWSGKRAENSTEQESAGHETNQKGRTA